MEDFKINVNLAGQPTTLLVIADDVDDGPTYRLIKDGVEISTMKSNGENGWEVSGTPLNADELDSISKEIEKVNRK